MNMTDYEAFLLSELRRLKAWDNQGSFTVHLTNDGRPSKIEITTPHRLVYALSTSEDVLHLTEQEA